jgi:hypothetical protein
MDLVPVQFLLYLVSFLRPKKFQMTLYTDQKNLLVEVTSYGRGIIRNFAYKCGVELLSHEADNAFFWHILDLEVEGSPHYKSMYEGYSAYTS